jgi:hypothetical protein
MNLKYNIFKKKKKKKKSSYSDTPPEEEVEKGQTINKKSKK